MRRIKLCDSKEEKRIEYPKLQKDIFITEENCLFGISGRYPVGSTVVIPANIWYFSVHAPINFKLISPLEKDDYISSLVWGGVDGPASRKDCMQSLSTTGLTLQSGMYWKKFGVEYIIEILPLSESIGNLDINTSFTPLSKGSIERDINSGRFRIYDDTFFLYHWASFAFTPLFMYKDQTKYINFTGKQIDNLPLSEFNNKKLFKEVYNAPEDFYMFLIPLFAHETFSSSGTLYIDSSKLKKFTMDDLNNF